MSWNFFAQSEPGGVVVGNFPELADVDELTPDEIIALLEGELEAGMTRMMVFPEIHIGEDGQTGQIWVQNDPVNRNGQQVIVRTLDGEVLFESGLILPGYQLNRITLSEPLTSGDHSVIIAIELYDLEAEVLLSVNTIDAVIRVQ
jgi:hypothetical protein